MMRSPASGACWGCEVSARIAVTALSVSVSMVCSSPVGRLLVSSCAPLPCRPWLKRVQRLPGSSCGAPGVSGPGGGGAAMGAAMPIVTGLELPEFDYLADDLTGASYHARTPELRGQGWLASSRLSYVVLDREAGEFFLRSKGTAFPGREIADLFGVTGGRLREQIDANILNLTGARHRRLRALV